MSKQNGVYAYLVKNRLSAAELFTDYAQVYENYFSNYQGVKLSRQSSEVLKRF